MPYITLGIRTIVFACTIMGTLALAESIAASASGIYQTIKERREIH